MSWNRLIITAVMILFIGSTFAQAPGSTVSWGRDDWGQADVPTDNDFVQVASGRNHGLALKVDGSIKSWGPDGYGQVSDTPTGTGFKQVAASGYNSLALSADGSIVSWGSEFSGSVTDTPTDTGYVQVAGGLQYHSLALKESGSIVSWGWDHLGQVTDSPTSTDFVQVAAGNHHSLALRTDGSIMSWGFDYYNQVTDTPTGTGFVQVDGGGYHSLALKADGSIVSWGRDNYGQVANTPNDTGFVQVAGGRNHSVALKADGSIVSWGNDDYNQVTNTPSGKGFLQVDGGGEHSIALLVHLSNETLTGEDVVVRPPPVDESDIPITDAPAISLTFETVSAAGETFVTITENGPPPGGLELIGIDGGATYIAIETTATFEGFVKVCINYSGFTLTVDPADLRLAHIVDDEWIDLPVTNDLFYKILCGESPSFSFFAIVHVPDPYVLLAELYSAVDGLDATEEVRLSLNDKLAKIERLLIEGDTAGVASDLVRKFITKVQKYRDKQISIPEADDLVRRASELINVVLY